MGHVPSRQHSLFFAVVAGACVGVVMGLALRYYLRERVNVGSAEAPAPAVDSIRVTDVAMRYARAVQQGDWERALESLEWVQQRLERVKAEEGEEGALRAKQEISAAVSRRVDGENVLRYEGVEDAYIFQPQARFEVVGVDAGDGSEFEAPVLGRAWLRVHYAQRTTALRDADGLPIASLVVGLTVSVHDRVMKGGIIGNCEIDWDSISYQWEPVQGKP